MFVAIHELAHVMSVTIGHNKEFYTKYAMGGDAHMKKGLKS